jgi:predicted permease
VIAFTTVLSLVAAVLSGLSPAFQASRADVVTALKDDSRAFSGRSRLRGAFVVSQVAFSLVLVVVAGLFVKALEQAGARDPGFDPAGVELASVDLDMAGYSEATGLRFWNELIERVRQMPNVQAASIANVFPGGFEGIGLGGLTLPGRSSGPREEVPISWNVVASGYFDTLRIPIIAGRDFNHADLGGAELVVIVSERLARAYWPDASAIGRSLVYQSPGRPPSSLVIVGVARELRSSSLIDGVAGSFVYLPVQQHYQPTMTIAARTTGGQRIAGDIRTLVASLDEKLPIVSARTLEDSAALGLVPQRVMASFSGSLGTVSVVLAAIGIYGLTSYSVARRTREIGIRIALGARPLNVVGMVIRQGLKLALIGSVIGLTLAAAAARLFVPFLFDVAPFDVATFAAAAAIVLGAGLAATYIPARRATAVDPVIALHQD